MTTKANIKARPRRQRYPVEWVAAEFGVDRKTLSRKLDAIGVDYSNGITLKEAHEAETRRNESEEARRRKNNAEAEAAELDLKQRNGVIAKEFGRMAADIAIKARTIISSTEHISALSRPKVIAEMKDIELPKCQL